MSLTLSAYSPPCLRHSSEICPPSGVYLIALSKRFSSILLSNASSASMGNSGSIAEDNVIFFAIASDLALRNTSEANSSR